jgi:hypothetical protein
MIAGLENAPFPAQPVNHRQDMHPAQNIKLLKIHVVLPEMEFVRTTLTWQAKNVGYVHQSGD